MENLDDIKVEINDNFGKAEYHIVVEMIMPTWPKDTSSSEKKNMLKLIEQRLREVVILRVTTDATKHLLAHTTDGTIPNYGTTPKIHIDPYIIGEEDVLVVMHPKKYADLLRKNSLV